MLMIHNSRLNKYQIEGISLRSMSSGKLWISPSRDNPSAYGSASGLLPISAISCNGCDMIRSSHGCDGAFEEA